MDIHFLIEPVLKQIRALPDGTVTSTKQLVDSIYGQPVRFGDEFFYDDGFELETEDYSILGRKLLFACAAKGITLDAAAYYERVVGLPADADYVIRKLRPFE